MADWNIDINPWLMSSMLSDLTQTANFTKRGYGEANPLAKPFVEGKSNIGEIGLGALGTAMALNKNTPDWIKALLALSHTAAVIHNNRTAGTEIPAIMFPMITAKW